MNISNSKKELARIISENGGWRDGAKWAAQDKYYSGQNNGVALYSAKPPRPEKGGLCWGGLSSNMLVVIEGAELMPNWHQTILSSEEYFHLYPAPDADVWIEWKGGECPVEEGTLIDVRWRNGVEREGVKALHLGGGASHQFWFADGMVNDIVAYRLHKPEQAKHEFCESVTRSIPEPESKPTIEQLAADYRNRKDYADRKQEEADAAKADADAALCKLELAGEAIGLIVTPVRVDKEPELVITDWRDLKVGDVVELISFQGGSAKVGENGAISKVYGDGDFNVDFPSQSGYSVDHSHIKFIRRP